jgi:LPS export ABC transporter protein LptC
LEKKLNHIRGCSKTSVFGTATLNVLGIGNFHFIGAARWLFYALLLTACSFDYGANDGSDSGRPDIVMENINYARVRGGDLLARFHAERAERWEERQTMELERFTFEQMEDHGKTVNVEGNAGVAAIQLDSGDMVLSGGVKIRIESEDVIINTPWIEWKDKEKTITGNEDDEVDIQRSDGTNFSGRGFSADIRSRTWNFSGEVKGTYVEKDD